MVCLLSALGVHDLGTQAPFEVWLALPYRAAVPKLAQAQLRIVRMSDRELADGVQHITVDGVAVPEFSAAKTVVDAFRFRNKMHRSVPGSSSTPAQAGGRVIDTVRDVKGPVAGSFLASCLPALRWRR